MPKSLIEFRDWSATEITNLLNFSIQIESEKRTEKSFQKVVALFFFEASTRTRVSFEMACYREGLQFVSMLTKNGTSLEKGETLEDTLENVRAMQPDLMVVRSGDDLQQVEWATKLKIPFISAGWGQKAHPTQALLDLRALLKKGRKISDIKMVIIGDVKHSRVASSHFELAQKLGYQVAVLSPEKVALPSSVKELSSLDEALSWGNVLMSLRFQFERHEKKLEEEALKKFQISAAKIKNWKADGHIMHPGPVNYGVELNEDIKSEKRNLILDQVESGVWIRRACLNYLLKDQS